MWNKSQENCTKIPVNVLYSDLRKNAVRIDEVSRPSFPLSPTRELGHYIFMMTQHLAQNLWMDHYWNLLDKYRLALYSQHEYITGSYLFKHLKANTRTLGDLVLLCLHQGNGHALCRSIQALLDQ